MTQRLVRDVTAILLGAATAGTMLMPSFAFAEAVGVTGAVNPAATGTPPGAPARPLILGSEVLFNERIVTGPGGQAHVLFLDQSSMIIGQNSTVVIDRFVYDPRAGTGEMSATLARGAMRFIGGKLSQQGKATLHTPVATVGIRGTDVSLAHEQSTNVLVGYGSAAVTPNGCTGPSCVANVLTGKQLTVDSATAPPGIPVPVTQGDVQQAKSSSEGQPGKTGGAAAPPTDTSVAQSGIAGAVQTMPGAPPPPPLPPPVVGITLGCDPNCTQNPTPPPPPTQTLLSGVFKSTIGEGLFAKEFGTRRDGTGANFGDPAFFGPNTRVFSDGAFVDSNLNAAVNAFTATLTSRPSPLYTVDSPPSDFPGAIGIVTDLTGKHTLAAGGPPIAAAPYNGFPVTLVATPDPGPPDPVLPGSLVDVNDSMLNALDRGFFGMKLNFLSADTSFCSPDPAPCQTGDYGLLFGGTPVTGSELITRNGTGGVTVRTFQLYRNVDGGDAPIAFLPAGLGDNNNNGQPKRFNSPLYLATPENSNQSNTSGRALYVGMAVSDTVTDGQSAAVVAVGGVNTTASGAPNPAYPLVSMAVRGSVLLGTDPADSFVMGSTTSSSPDGQGRALYGPTTGPDAGTTQFFVLDENGRGGAFSGATSYQNRVATISDFGAPPLVSTYGFNHIAEYAGTFVPGGRTERTLYGFVGGMGASQSAGNPLDPGPLTSDPVDTSAGMDNPAAGLIIKTNPQSDNSRLTASMTFRPANWAAGSQYIQLLMGHDPTAPSDVGSSAAFIDDTMFAAVDRDFASGTTGVVTPGGTQAPSAFIKPNASQPGAAAASTTQLFTVGALADAANNKTGEQVLEGLLGLSPGTIQPNAYLTWGFWGGEVRGPGTFPNDQLNNAFRGRSNLATWVAGEMPAIDLSRAGFGTATYSGNAIGTVLANGVQYPSVGSFSNEFNFGTGIGNVTISNFDGRNVTGTVNALVSDWRQYQGASLASTSGALTIGSVTGAFFAPSGVAASPPLATGGNFLMQDRTNAAAWSASGILVGKR